MKTISALLLVLLATGVAYAGEADVLAVEVQRTGGDNFSFETTVCQPLIRLERNH